MAAFDAPPGLPLTLFAKLKAPGQNTGDLQISGNEIKLKQSNKWTQFEHIYDQQSRAKDIVESGLQRAIPLVLDGYSVSVFVFGTHASDKREILIGIIELLFTKLYNQLSNKSSSFKVQLNALEIVEDAIYDLMDVNNSNLVIEHTIDGPSVLNLHTATLTSSNDFSMLFNEIMDNRTQQLTEFGPKASKASFFLSIKISHNDNHCMLHFVEFPAADKLTENPVQLRMREGPTSNKELIGISNLINSWSDQKWSEAPYKDCKSNMLLQEIFGGNCVSFGIICIDISSETEANKCVLQYANKLKVIENYPVINSERMRGLLLKYYKRYHAIVCELNKKSRDRDADMDRDIETERESALLELRSSLIGKEKELIAVHGDKDKLRESYGEFRNKYNILSNKNNDLQKELISSEETCLRLSKSLIDVQIENNELKKNESHVRAEYETKLIGAENDILETGMREQNLAQDIVGLNKEMVEMHTEKKTLSIEYVALRANYTDLNQELDDTKEEQTHLNVQLINLINANKAFEETSQRLTQENEILMTKNQELSTDKETLKTKYKEWETEMLRMKTLSDKQGIELVKYEVEIARMKIQMDATKTEYQKKWLKVCKEKEIELQNVTNQRSNESQHNKAQTQQLEREVETLKGQVRVANRQIANSQQKCIEYEEQIITSNKECDKLRDSLKIKTDEFKSKLLAYLQRVTAGNDNNIHIEDLKVTQKKLYQELSDTHNGREEELMSEAENERKKTRKLHQQVQTLTQRLLLLQDFVKDVAPDTALPVSIGTTVSDVNVESLTNELEQRDERLKQKINTLERALGKEKRAHVNTAERAQTQQEGIQRELLSLKKILREQHSNCDPMSHQIKIEYQENLTKLKTLQSTLQQQIEYNVSTQKRMETMHANVLETINIQNGTVQQKNQMLETQIVSLQNEIKSVNEQNKELKNELSQGNLLLKEQNKKQRRSSLASVIHDMGTDDENAGKYQKQIQNLKKKYQDNDVKYRRKIQDLKNTISELETNTITQIQNVGDSSVVWDRVSKLEKEKAELIAKLTALEAEYNTMETHYKKEVHKYKSKNTKKRLLLKLKK